MKTKVLSIILMVVFVLLGCGNDTVKEGAVNGTVGAEVSAEAAAEFPKSTTAQTGNEAMKPKETKIPETDIVTERVKEKLTAEGEGEVPQTTQKPTEAGKTGTTEKPIVTEGVSSVKQPTVTKKPETQTICSSQPTDSEADKDLNSPSPGTSEPMPHTCTWNGGSITTEATCSSEGVKTYICTGCGNTRTESVAKASHTYVTENIPATCVEAGKTKIYCSICGEVQSETSSGVPTGHNFVKEVAWGSSEPTCTTGGYYNLVCSDCGAFGGEGIDPALGHTPVSREISHGDCVTNTIVVTECSVCGWEISREAYYEDDHDWITGTSDPVWDDTIGDFITHEIIYCSRCGMRKE